MPIQPASTVLISGASSGIGWAASLRFAEAGHRVIAVARTRSKLEALSAAAEGMKGSVHPEALDAADGEAVLELAERLRQEGLSPSVLIHCAGLGSWKFIENTSPAEAKLMLNAPYLAAFNLTHAFMTEMLRRRHGLILHVGSPASICAWPGATSYTAARWALRGLHEALCQDLAGTGVRSCHIYFGEVTSSYFQTNAVDREFLPTLGTMIPPISPEQAGEQLLRLARRPRRDVSYPFLLSLFSWWYRWMPSMTRWMARFSPRPRPLPAPLSEDR